MTSFQRQLNLYGFHRISKGADAGRYQHTLFMRGRPDLVSQIKREPRVQQREPSPPLGGAAGPAVSPLGPPSVRAMDAHPASGISMPMADHKAAETSAFDTENAALAMLSMTRPETQSNDTTAQVAVGGSDSKAPSPDNRKALSDSNIDAQMNIGAKLQQSLTRQSSLEAELTTLKNEMIGMNRTIEALARTVQMQQGSENHLSLHRMQLDNHKVTTAAEDRQDRVHQAKRRRSSESDVDLSALNTLQLNSPQLSSSGEEDDSGNDRPGENLLDLESTGEMSERESSAYTTGSVTPSSLAPGPGEKRRCESSDF